MVERLKNKVAVITGSGRGIGRAIAMSMAQEGARVVTNAQHSGGAEAVAREIVNSGGQAIPFCGDISDFNVAGKLVQAALEHFGSVDILVNNAGIASGLKPIWDMAEDEWNPMIAVHLKGTFNCIRHACVIMKEQKWGRIINTVSRARLGLRHNANYGAAKAGIVGLTKCVAVDMAPYGVTCNAYSASAATRMTSTDEMKARLRKSYEEGEISREFRDSLLNVDPPEALAPLVVYLCTQQAAAITGQVFSITKRDVHIYAEELKQSLFNDGGWTVEELTDAVPRDLLGSIAFNLGPRK